MVLAAPDRDTAQWSADSLGRSEVEEVTEGFSYGANTIRDGVSLTPRRELRALALASETRSLTFVIDGPERPAAPLRWRPWFCRFVVEASVEGYMLHKTTILSFPEDFAMAKLTRFMREPLMQGCPPELSWCEGIEGTGGYSIALNTGGGTGWGLHDEASVRAFIRKTVEDHLEVIAAMDRLAADWNDDDAFDALLRRATDANIAC